MPRVLRIINRFNLGGPTYNAAYLSRYMPPEFETLLVGGEKDDTEDSSEFIVKNLGLNPVIIPEMKREIDLKNDYEAYRKMVNIIRDFKPDIVHTHASKAGTIGRLAAANMNVPAIVHTFHGHVFHSYFGKMKTVMYKNIERNLARRSSTIIAISEKQKTELCLVHRICKPDKIKVIPLGFDLSRFNENKDEKRKVFRDRYKLTDDEIAIGIIGRIVPVKNHKLFLEATKEVLQKTNQKLRFFIIGDGEDRLRVEAMATELQLDFADATISDAIKPLTFTSWIKEIDVALAGLDIVALTSLNEGTPVSLIEAQAANKPIVTTNVGGIENVVIEGVTALLSHSKTDASQFAAQLLELTESVEKRYEMARVGWDHVKNKFHYTRLVRDMTELYYELLDPVYNSVGTDPREA
ncbi:MAG: glycosyltransferase [Bacteroidetes bacterium]|nr:glycosyltransferase [Bacteroidota bacterium]